MSSLVAALLLMGISVMVWRWTARAGAYKFSARHLSGTVLGLVAFGLAAVVLINLGDLARDQKILVPRDVTFLAPVQQPGSALSAEVSNLADKASFFGLIGNAWPAVFALEPVPARTYNPKNMPLSGMSVLAVTPLTQLRVTRALKRANPP